MTNFSVTSTEPVSETRPTSLRPRSISIRCSAISFGISQQLLFQRQILFRRVAPPAGAGQRPVGDHAVFHPGENLRRAGDDLKLVQIHEVHIG